MSLKLLFAVCCIMSLLASCSHDYEPALYHQDIVYMPKPASFDSVKSATYISGAYSDNFNSNGSDNLVSGQLNISEGHTFKYFNLAYGVFATYGKYENQTVGPKAPAAYFTNKYYGAVGARVAGSTYFKSHNIDFRIIGFEAAYSSEYGAYAGYRDYLKQLPNFYVDNRTYLFSIGATSEIVFHSFRHPKLEQGVYGFAGSTTGHDALNTTFFDANKSNSLFNPFIKAGYFFKFNHLFGSIEVGNMIFLRAGYVF